MHFGADPDSNRLIDSVLYDVSEIFPSPRATFRIAGSPWRKLMLLWRALVAYRIWVARVGHELFFCASDLDDVAGLIQGRMVRLASVKNPQ